MVEKCARQQRGNEKSKKDAHWEWEIGSSGDPYKEDLKDSDLVMYVGFISWIALSENLIFILLCGKWGGIQDNCNQKGDIAWAIFYY